MKKGNKVVKSEKVVENAAVKEEQLKVTQNVVELPNDKQVTSQEKPTKVPKEAVTPVVPTEKPWAKQAAEEKLIRNNITVMVKVIAGNLKMEPRQVRLALIKLLIMPTVTDAMESEIAKYLAVKEAAKKEEALLSAVNTDI